MSKIGKASKANCMQDVFSPKQDLFAKSKTFINPKSLLGRFIGGQNLLTLDDNHWIEQHKVRYLIPDIADNDITQHFHKT